MRIPWWLAPRSPKGKGVLCSHSNSCHHSVLGSASQSQCRYWLSLPSALCCHVCGLGATWNAHQAWWPSAGFLQWEVLAGYRAEGEWEQDMWLPATQQGAAEAPPKPDGPFRRYSPMALSPHPGNHLISSAIAPHSYQACSTAPCLFGFSNPGHNFVSSFSLC